MQDNKMEKFSKETKTKKELSLEEAKLVSGGINAPSAPSAPTANNIRRGNVTVSCKEWQE